MPSTSTASSMACRSRQCDKKIFSDSSSHHTNQRICFTMTTGNKIRFGFIAALWLALCWLLITRSPRIDFMVIFTIVASGIIVFVPLYKKYLKK